MVAVTCKNVPGKHSIMNKHI